MLEPLGPPPAVTPAEPTLRRLTTAQYENSLHVLFGDDLVLPTSIEPDTAVSGLYAVGAAQTSLSPFGVERYEEAAYSLAGQILAEDKRSLVATCSPQAPVDEACAREIIEGVGRKVWRRPLSTEESDRLTGLAVNASTTLDDFYSGLQYGLAAILQSPYFLYRVELGSDDGTGRIAFDNFELASRLSYFFWNTTPDEELLAAAEQGLLTTDEGLAAQVDRLMADDRAREGVRSFFTEMLTLYLLDDLSKDPTLFLHFSPDLGPSAREETLLGIEDLVFTKDADFRELFTTQHTFLDRKLAAVYNVRAPALEGFGETDLPADGGRRGFLGQISFLAPNSHATSTSATRRGIFVRQVLMCQTVLPPPANLNTSIPEVSKDAPTLRDRVAIHLTDPYCAGCHNSMDKVGLGFENFDAVGGWRRTENDAVIDASGDLDGESFENAWELSGLLAESERFPRCLTKTLYQYANGHAEGEGEEEMISWLAEDFARSDHSVKALMRSLALSEGFATAGEVVP